jgi:hypothetical protein
MDVINWPQLQLGDADLSQLAQGMTGLVHIRTFCQTLVRNILKSYPWRGRSDLISIYDPVKTYQPGDFIALPQCDPQRLRPDTWRIGVVNSIVDAENPIQGKFQVITLKIDGRERRFAANIKDAKPLPINFPPKDEGNIDQLVNDIVNEHQNILSKVILTAIQDGRLKGIVRNDQVFIGDAFSVCSEEERYYLGEIFKDVSIENPWLIIAEILKSLRELDCLIDIPDDFACFAIEQALIDLGYRDLGGKQWTTQQIFDQLNREVARRMQVPVNRSQIAKEFGVDDSQDFLSYEEVDLDTDSSAVLVDLGEEQYVEEPAINTWQPPIAPIMMAPLTYIQIFQGYFPLTKQLSKAFDPKQDLQLVHIRIIEGDYVPFIISLEEKLIKSLDPDKVGQIFLKEREPAIPAGTYLWLEHQGGLQYRIAPHPMSEPRQVKCKQVWLENGILSFEEAEISMIFEGDPHLFKAELRFEDIEALFKEAEQSGLSIFDAMWYTFPKLAELHPQGYVYHKDLFNAVFFQHRMCSPRSVVTELYSRPCFIPTGDGYFRFEPERGIQRKITRRSRNAHPLINTHEAQIETPQGLRHFIFQQSSQSDYEDKLGVIYNWRQGIPGSNLITIGSRFIYYRTGDKVFFGTGKIERIDKYQGDDGQIHSNGFITDYQAWDPPLLLNQELGQQLSFIKQDRLWIGQAGIRQIDQADFQALLRANDVIQNKTYLPPVIEELEPIIGLKTELVPILHNVIRAYQQDPLRANTLYCRALAHKKIRDLLSRENLDKLTLDKFNREIWQAGEVVYKGRSISLLSDDWLTWLRAQKLSQIKADFEAGKLKIIGNQTWGSATRIVAPMLKKSDKEKETLILESLDYLLYGYDPVEKRISEVCSDPNGLGMNVVCGILHAMYPDDYILYNTRSIAALNILGIPWTRNWGQVKSYWAYCDFCQQFRHQFGFESLTDVDWFMYNLTVGLVKLPETINEVEIIEEESNEPQMVQDKPTSVTLAITNRQTWWCAIDRNWSSYDELKKRKVIAQGVPALGSLEPLLSLIGQKDIFKQEIIRLGDQNHTHPEDRWWWNEHKSNVNKIPQSMWNLLNIETGDLVIALEGTTVRGICEVILDAAYSYQYQTTFNYAHAICYPVEWVDWDNEQLGPPPPTSRQGLYGIKQLHAQDYVFSCWAKRSISSQSSDTRPHEVGKQSFWTNIKSLEEQELHTLDENKPFQIKHVRENSIEIITSTGEPRSVRRKEIENAWETLIEYGRITRSQIQYHFSKFNPAFIAAILAEMPGVEYQISPIRLYFSSEQKDDGLKPPNILNPESEQTSTLLQKEDGLEVIPTNLTNPVYEEDSSSTQPEFTKKGQAHFLPKGPLFNQKADLNHKISVLEPSKPTRTTPNISESAPQSKPSFSSPTHRGETQKSSPKRDDMQTKTLFSNHFLQTRLPSVPEWNDDPQLILESVRVLWQKARQHGEHWNEAQTEQDFIKPILAVLGWTFMVQPKSKKGSQVTRPDYALFADERIKNEANKYQGNDDAFYSRTLAVAEAKYWGRPLSQKDKTGRDEWKAAANPSHQMVSYLVGTHCPWGILTNGITWRLYSREVSSTASEYYEIDLGVIFDFLPSDGEPTSDQLDLFRRWWLFFRRDAFTLGEQGKSFVQRIHEGSTTYASEISTKLKELVFEEVMPEIAGGFVAYRYHVKGIHQETTESLNDIYQASLSFLYKLLFILYAEARGLLPINNPGYQEQSLTTIAQWAAEKLDQGQAISDAPHATPRYDALLGLFHRIDQGDSSLGIPHYNGGLFNPSRPENQFLETYRLSDRAVAHAVDTLVRDAGQPVDYAYISVRNLGAIYEGLLENKLMVGDAVAGIVGLVNDKGERKATGSFYTPDYIVEYIVQHTLDPILEARDVEFRSSMQLISELRKKLLNTADPITNQRLQFELKDAEHNAREAFLGIKVLDPAMGSGHFLVNAVDHLTDGIIQRMQAYHDVYPEALWEWNPIQQLIEHVRSEILQEMAKQGLVVDDRRLDDTALLTRLVMKRCIYGVDLNPMAVELAKVGLWLHSFTVGAPLSFMDHHLRWGNSLIGVWEIEKYIIPGTGRWNDVVRTLSDMVQISEMTDSTLGEVAQSSALYNDSRDWIRPTIERLNVELTAYFTNWGKNAKTLSQVAKIAYLGDDIQQNESGLVEKYREAQQIAKEKCFFHWKLEFPEAFINLRTQSWSTDGGFDAVISNPPYKDIKGLDKEFVKYLFAVYLTTENRTNIFGSFFERGLSLLNKSASNLGLIVPTPLLTQISYQKLRNLILCDYWVQHIIRLPNELFGNVMGDVKVDTCVVIAGSKFKENNLNTQVLIYDSFERKELITPGTANKLFEFSQKKWLENPEHIISMSGSDDLNLLEKIKMGSQPLKNLCEFCLGLTPYDRYSGHTEEQIKNKVFHANSQLDSTYKKLLVSGDVGRYLVEWNGSEWIKYGDWLAAPREQRFFTQERILVQQIIDWSSLRIFAGITSDELYNTQNQFNLLAKENINLNFILAILCSKLMSFYHRKVYLDVALQRFQKVLIKDAKMFPIRLIAFATPAENRDRELVIVQSIYSTDNMDNIFTFALQHLPGQLDIVHDLLAFLAKQMIALNKERQSEVKGFLAWLEREIGSPLVSLTGRTKIRNYLGSL